MNSTLTKVTATPVPAEKMLKVYRRKVFTYNSSEGDERFFRQGMVDFLKAMPQPLFSENPDTWYHPMTNVSFKQDLINMIWERNGGGVTTRYMHFSDKNQRLYLENTFFEWAKLMAAQILKELKQLAAAEQNK